MTQLEHSENAANIADLHQQIVTNVRKSLGLAIQIGGLLTEQRNKLQHGQWENWVETHLPFKPRTASNYMRLHLMRHQIKSENVSDLTDAYKLLAAPAPMDQYEAGRVSAQIQDALHSLAAGVIPFIDELRRIREQGEFAPEYPTFEAYLLAFDMTLEEFRAKEQMSEALTAWTSGCSAHAVFKCLCPGLPDDDAGPREEND